MYIYIKFCSFLSLNLLGRPDGGRTGSGTAGSSSVHVLLAARSHDENFTESARAPSPGPHLLTERIAQCLAKDQTLDLRGYLPRW